MHRVQEIQSCFTKNETKLACSEVCSVGENLHRIRRPNIRIYVANLCRRLLAVSICSSSVVHYNRQHDLCTTIDGYPKPMVSDNGPSGLKA